MQENTVRVQSILGKEVITLKDGSFIGKIQAVATNPEEKKVVGVYVKLKGILSGKNFVPFSNIQAFGSHSVTLKEDYEPETSSKAPEEKDIIGMPIITIDGTLLGKVDDYTFDAESGVIKEYILSEGLVQDTLRGKGVLNNDKVSRIGKDVIVALADVDESGLEELDPLYEDFSEEEVNELEELADDAVEKIEEEKEEIQEVIDTSQEEADKAWQQSIKKAKDVSEKWTNKVKEQAEKVGEEAKELWSEAQSTVMKQLEKLNHVREKWQEKLTKLGNTRQDELGEQLLNEIKGKTISKPLVDDLDNIIVEPGQIIDNEVITKAMEAGKLHDLFKLAAAKDVEDRIIEIEKIDN